MRWATRVAALAIAVLLTHASAAAAWAQTPTPSETPADGSGGPPPVPGFDPSALADAISKAFGSVLTEVLTKSLPALLVTSFFTVIGTVGKWVYDGMSGIFDKINVVTQTPKSLAFFGLPSVNDMFSGLSGVAFALVGVVIVIAGFAIMARRSLGGTFPELQELLPRLGVALLWVVSMPVWFPLALDFTNGVCQVITRAAGSPSTLPGWQAIGGVDEKTLHSTAQGVILLVYALAGMFLFLQSLIRIAVLNLAAVAAPLALLCWVLPQWQWLYSIWVRIFVAAFATQIVQTLALGLGASLMASVTGMLGGGNDIATSLLTAAIGLATMFAAWSLPKQVVGAYGPSLTLPQALLTAVATGAAVARGVGVAGTAAAGIGSAAGAAGLAAGAGAAGAAAGLTSIVPLPPPPVGAVTPAGPPMQPPPFPPIAGFPGAS
jgi:hypothetical protein